MTREWGPSGVGYPEGTLEIALAQDDWEQIVAMIASHTIERDRKVDLMELRRGIELALRTYHIVKHQMTATSPSIVRENLAQLIERLDRLLEHLNRLDMNSRLLVSEAGRTPFDQWFGQIIELKNQVRIAEAFSLEYSRKSGRLKDFAMLNMANQLAITLAQNLGAPAVTPNPNGLFGNILVVLLRVARRSLDDPDPGRITRAGYDFYISCQGSN